MCANGEALATEIERRGEELGLSRRTLFTAPPAHAAAQPVLSEQLLVIPARVLATAIRMVTAYIAATATAKVLSWQVRRAGGRRRQA